MAKPKFCPVIRSGTLRFGWSLNSRQSIYTKFCTDLEAAYGDSCVLKLWDLFPSRGFFLFIYFQPLVPNKWFFELIPVQIFYWNRSWWVQNNLNFCADYENVKCKVHTQQVNFLKKYTYFFGHNFFRRVLHSGEFTLLEKVGIKFRIFWYPS